MIDLKIREFFEVKEIEGYKIWKYSKKHFYQKGFELISIKMFDNFDVQDFNSNQINLRYFKNYVLIEYKIDLHQIELNWFLWLKK